MADKSSVFAIVAGPLYVEFLTEKTYPPCSDYHTVLVPRKERPWSKQREVGGSAYKLARYWAETKGPAAFVTRVPTPLCKDGDDGWRERAFYDDAKWLRSEVNTAADAQARFFLQLLPGSGTCCPDYTFHLEHPEADLWPVFSLGKGAASELAWSDVVNCWKRNREAVSRSAMTIICLMGLCRTRLSETLAEAIRKKDSTTEKVLKEVKLYIDLGRTDFRYEKKNVKDVQTCIRRAHTALVDHSTKVALGLGANGQFPREYLIVRPHGVLAGRWWLYRQTDNKKPNKLERAHFASPDPIKQASVSGRPARVAEVISGIASGGMIAGISQWMPFAEINSFTEPEEITEDEKLLHTLRRIQRRLAVDRHFNRILIYGPTGSGKEVIARWLYNAHPYLRHGRFVAVSCGRLEGSLVNAELFGNTKNAFTGAAERKGAFIAANGGFLLIDDLDTLPLVTQAKLLRVLEDNEVCRLGADVPESINLFVVATTNRPPEELVRRERLRVDLYYRLMAGGILEIPPLDRRPADLLRIARSYWEQRNTIWNVDYSWPQELGDRLTKMELRGNCRQLDVIIEHVHAMAREKNGRCQLAEVELRDRLGIEDERDDIGEYSAPINSKKGLRGSSPIFDQLRRECGGLLDESDHNSRFSLFLDLWEQACMHINVEDKKYLTARQILECLGGEQEDRALVLRMLKACPRTDKVYAGPKTRWRLVPNKPVVLRD